MLVPAFAGSTPNFAKPKGRAVPVSTEVMTIAKRDREMAEEFIRLPFVKYTLTKPPAAKLKSYK